MIEVLLLGYGLAGSVFHAPLLGALPGFKLKAVVTKRKCDVAPTYPDWQSALQAGPFDLAVVATPNDTHADLAGGALRAGMHVVVDKPFATSAKEARDLVELAGQCGRVLTVFHNRRWDRDFLALRDRLPELGRIYRFESRFERWRPEIKAGWRETEVAGAGVLWDLGPHLIDQALVLFGPPVKVYAEKFVRRPGALVDDDAFLAIEHRGGTVSHLWMNAIAERQAPRFRVLAEGGHFWSEGLDPQEGWLREGATPALPDFPYLKFYIELENAILHGGQPPVDAVDAVHGLTLIESAV